MILVVYLQPIFILSYRLYFSEIHTQVLNIHFIIFPLNLTFPLAPFADSTVNFDKCQTILLKVRQLFLDLGNSLSGGKNTKWTLSFDFFKIAISEVLTNFNPYLYINPP